MLRVIILCCLWGIHLAAAWSGSDAHTLIALTSIDTDAKLRDVFYNSPAGAFLIVPSDGAYMVLDIPFSGGTPVRVPRDENVASVPAIMTRRSRLPYHIQLSDDWVVLERPVIQASRAVTVLLHCRLPLPHSQAQEAKKEVAYVEAYGPAMADTLQQWWRRNYVTAQPSGCLYGFFGQLDTRMPVSLSLCALGSVRRVRTDQLMRIILRPKEYKDWAERKQGGALNEKSEVTRFLKDMHSSAERYTELLTDPKVAAAFEEIGHFHSRLSRPRWNAEMRVWELLYPSTQPCHDFYGKNHSSQGIDASDGTYPLNTWHTVVRLRCYAKAGESKGYWSVTEVQQMCRYEIEIASELVCGWEQELDSIRVNPIPCAEIS